MTEQEKRQKQEESKAEFYSNLVEESKNHGSKNTDRLLDAAKQDGLNIQPKKEVTKAVKQLWGDVDYEYVEEEGNYSEDPYSDLDDDQLQIPSDLVQLPSKGLIYGNGFKSKIAVSFLTAADEDAITNPQYYEGDLLTDILIRRKVLDKNIKPEMLCTADREAIMLWLRTYSYSNMFPITVADPITGERFDSEVDLTTIKPKPFKLKPNDNGLFEFTLPKTGDLIEFRFLVHKDEVDYNKILKKTNEKLKKYSLETSVQTLNELISADKEIETNKKKLIDSALKTIENYVNSIPEPSEIAYNKGITYRLEKSIVSVNGNRDRKAVHDYVVRMIAFDSLALRRYISNNIPSLDYSIEIQRPDYIIESLGGEIGIPNTFHSTLEFGITAFLNV